MGVCHHALPGHGWQNTAGQFLHGREIIVAEPDGGGEISGKAHEPGIAIVLGRTRFACHARHRKCGAPARAALGHLHQHGVHLKCGLFRKGAVRLWCVTAKIPKNLSVGCQDLRESVTVSGHARIGEDVKACCLIHDGHFGCAEHHRLMGGDGRFHTHCLCERDNGRRGQIIAGKAHRHAVERADERGGEINPASKTAPVIARRPVAPADRCIGNDGAWCQPLFHGSRIDIGLEG